MTCMPVRSLITHHSTGQLCGTQRLTGDGEIEPLRPQLRVRVTETPAQVAVAATSHHLVGARLAPRIGRLEGHVARTAVTGSLGSDLGRGGDDRAARPHRAAGGSRLVLAGIGRRRVRRTRVENGRRWRRHRRRCWGLRITVPGYVAVDAAIRFTRTDGDRPETRQLLDPPGPSLLRLLLTQSIQWQVAEIQVVEILCQHSRQYIHRFLK